MARNYIERGIIVGFYTMGLMVLDTVALCESCFQDYMAGKFNISPYDADELVGRCRIALMDEELKYKVNNSKWVCTRCEKRISFL